MNVTDPRFKYTKSINTDIRDTLRKFGFKPTTDAERKARQKKMHEPPAEPTNVTAIETKKRKAK